MRNCVDAFPKMPLDIQSLLIQFVGEPHKMQQVCKQWHEIITQTHNRKGNRYWSIYLSQLRVVCPKAIGVIVPTFTPKQKVHKLMQSLWSDLRLFSNAKNYIDGRSFPSRGFLTATQYQELRAFVDRERDRNFVALGKHISSLPAGLLHGTDAEQATILRAWIKTHALSLETVQELDCNGENITSITDEMMDLLKKMKRLSVLKIRYSPQLRVIPLGIGQLRYLERLHLESNRLTSVPADITHLKKLYYIDIRNNLLTDIPSSLFRRDIAIYATGNNNLGTSEQLNQWRTISKKGTYICGSERCAKIAKTAFYNMIYTFIGTPFGVVIGKGIGQVIDFTFYGGGFVAGAMALGAAIVVVVALRVFLLMLDHLHIITIWADALFGERGATLALYN